MRLTGGSENLLNPQSKAEFEKEKYNWFQEKQITKTNEKQDCSKFNSTVMAWLHYVR
jgi:hypothetical protein